MVSLVVSNNTGLANGKAPPSDLGLTKNNLTNNYGTSGNGNGVVKGPGGGEGGGQRGEGGTAPRKLTKNEKRRQKNKLRKAQALDGAAADKTRVESNGVAVASWPPPPAPKEEGADLQVRSGVRFPLVCCWAVCESILATLRDECALFPTDCLRAE